MFFPWKSWGVPIFRVRTVGFEGGELFPSSGDFVLRSFTMQHALHQSTWKTKGHHFNVCNWLSVFFVISGFVLLLHKKTWNFPYTYHFHLFISIIFNDYQYHSISFISTSLFPPRQRRHLFIPTGPPTKSRAPWGHENAQRANFQHRTGRASWLVPPVLFVCLVPRLFWLVDERRFVRSCVWMCVVQRWCSL